MRYLYLDTTSNYLYTGVVEENKLLCEYKEKFDHDLSTMALQTIIKEYPDGELPLYHMDVYRLDGKVEGLGIEEYFSKGGVTIIEWADLIKDYLPEERLDIKFKVIDENTRVLILRPHGEDYQRVCEDIL